jgi:hypothetical protein
VNSFRLSLNTNFQRLAESAKTATSPSKLDFRVSLCGSYLTVVNNQKIYLYAMIKGGHRRQLSPGRQDMGNLFRPVTTIQCPRTVIACAVDTTRSCRGIAILMDGRLGMTCDIPQTPEDFGSIGLKVPIGGPSSKHGKSRTMYRSIASLKDPPRSVALLHSRHCVAFGCSEGVELH